MSAQDGDDWGISSSIQGLKREYSAEDMIDEDHASTSSMQGLKRELSTEDTMDEDQGWHYPKGSQPKPKVPSKAPSGFIACSDLTIHASYERVVPDHLFEQIAQQTNLYASAQSIIQPSLEYPWVATDKEEVKRFFGLTLWMGLVRLPSLGLYWTDDPAYAQSFSKSVMARDRYEVLLKMISFSNNQQDANTDGLSEIQPLVDTLQENFKKHFVPTADVSIEELLIPVRGATVSWRQEHNKKGNSLMKLYCGSGYTYGLRVRTKKEHGKGKTADEAILSLCGDLFNRGHTLYTDSRYTSLSLAEKLLDKSIHLVGIVDPNRKGIPPTVLSKQLVAAGEMIAMENSKGITILKWKDEPEELILLSTKGSAEMMKIECRNRATKSKPLIMVDYNRARTVLDLSNRGNSSYSSLALCKPMKWYRKLGFELLLNTAVTNAYLLYKDMTKKQLSIADYRKDLAVALTQYASQKECSPPVVPATPLVIERPQHYLDRMSGPMTRVRRYCKQCYAENVAMLGRIKGKLVTKKVTSYCRTCDGQPFLCLECFNKIH